jgi:tetratricopeptide (TPR) repeat protein
MKRQMLNQREGRGVGQTGGILTLCAGWLALLVLFLSAFPGGSFYEEHQVWVQIFMSLAGLAYWIGERKRFRAMAVPNGLPAVAGILMAAFFFSGLGAVYPRQAWLEFGKYTCCLVWIWLCDGLNHRIPAFKGWFQKGLVCSGLAMALIGLDMYLGGKGVALLNRCFALLGKDGEGDGFFFNLTENSRLYGTFQYPNTAAIYWMAAYLLALAWAVNASGKRERVMAAACAIWIQTAFFLTVSRGAYLLLIPVLILFLCSAPAENRMTAGIMAVLTSGAGFIAGALIAGGGENPPVYWLVLAGFGIGAGAAATGVTAPLGAALRGMNRARLTGLLAAALILAVSGGLWAMNWTQPIKFGRDQRTSSLARLIQLPPGQSCRLVLTWQGEYLPSEIIGHVRVQSQSVSELIETTETGLLDADITLMDQGYDFTVPEDGRVQRVIITVSDPLTDITLTAAEVMDQTGRLLRSIPLSYVLLPESVAERIQAVFLPSTPGLLRASYYKDGLRMFLERPIWGGGGGAWEYLYGQYQSYEYYTVNAHNYPLQLAVEAGFLGIIGWLGLAALLAWQFWRRFTGRAAGEAEKDLLRPACMAAAFGLFAHGCMDFDFSYISVLMLFWGLLSLLSWDPAPAPFARIPKCPGMITSMLMLLLILAGTWTPFSLLMGKFYAVQYSKAGLEEDYGASAQYMDRAIGYDGFNPFYKLDLANLLILATDRNRAQEADALADEGLRLGWHNQDFLYEALEYYGKAGRHDMLLKVLRQIPLLRPLASDGWQTKALVLGQMAERFGEVGRMDEALALLEEAMAIPQEAERVCEGRPGRTKISDETLRLIERYRIAAAQGDVTHLTDPNPLDSG